MLFPDPILSVCIPTYNRSSLLQKAVEAVCDQINQEIELLVEIVIVDNFSTDNTSLIVQKIREKYERIRINYVRRPENIGTDNVIFCTEFAIGEFVFILSDDDILLNNSINYIIKNIKSNQEIKAITVNSCGMTLDGIIDTENKKFYRKKFIQNSSSSLKFLSTSISFLSSVIYRRKDVSLELLKEFKGSQVIQCFAFIQSLSATGIHIIDPEPIIAYRQANTQYDWFTVFTSQYFVFLNYMKYNNISNLDVFYLKSSHYFLSIIPHIMVCKTDMKIGANFKFDEIVTFEKINSFYPHFYIITKLLFLAPSNYLVVIYETLRKIKKTVLEF